MNLNELLDSVESARREYERAKEALTLEQNRLAVERKGSWVSKRLKDEKWLHDYGPEVLIWRDEYATHAYPFTTVEEKKASIIAFVKECERVYRISEYDGDEPYKLLMEMTNSGDAQAAHVLALLIKDQEYTGWDVINLEKVL